MTKIPSTVNPIGCPQSRLRNTFTCSKHMHRSRSGSSKDFCTKLR